MVTPTQCHLRTQPNLTREDIRSALETVKTYEDDSHLMRHLMQCRQCGQLYFHEFFEIVDWVNGNDAQYSTWIPVADAESADRLSALSPFELVQHGGLRVDFPKDADKPSAPYWSPRPR